MPISALKSRVIVGDFHLSTTLTSVSPTHEVTMLDYSCLTDTAKVFVPGQDSSTFTLEGFVDSVGSGQMAQLETWKTAGGDPVVYGPSGLAVGAELWMVSALEAQFVPASAAADRITFTLDCQTDGRTDFGVSLHDLAAETGTVDEDSFDGSASSAGGGVAQLHVTAFSGTDCDIEIQHSANDSSWSTLAAFTSVTGATAERVAVTGTVNRYLRASVTGGTFSSVTFQAGFARR